MVTYTYKTCLTILFTDVTTAKIITELFKIICLWGNVSKHARLKRILQERLFSFMRFDKGTTVHSNHKDVLYLSVFDLYLTITNNLCISCVIPENI